MNEIQGEVKKKCHSIFQTEEEYVTLTLSKFVSFR